MREGRGETARKGKEEGKEKKKRAGSSYNLQSLFSSLNELSSTGAYPPQAQISSNRESDRYKTPSPNEADSLNSASPPAGGPSQVHLAASATAARR